MESEKPRINNTDLVFDRISPLPDSILGYILSFLPTKEAVRTTILSKRWKFVWVIVHNLDFYFHDSQVRWQGAKDMAFVEFVYRVLIRHDAGSLNKFSLSWHSCILSHVLLWIKCVVITKNVSELYLFVGQGDILKIPITGFNCNSLQSLKVRPLVFHYDDTATVVCLPRLERLILHNVHFTSKEACEKLISGCPRLQYLKLILTVRDHDNEDAVDDFMCIISSASLRRLDLYFEYSSRLKLKAPSLEYLRLHGDISEIFVEKSLSSLVHALFDIKLDKDDLLLNNSIVEAVRAFDCAKFLTLSEDVVLALSHATISLSTEFTRLVILKASCYCSSVQDFIQSSSNLEALLIYQGWGLGTQVPPDDQPRWNAPLQVLGCLSNTLKKVRFDGYKGLEEEREMIRYMLKHGSVLEVMQINCRDEEGDDREKLEWLQEICEFPRKSPDCKVQFCVARINDRRFEPLICNDPTWPKRW